MLAWWKWIRKSGCCDGSSEWRAAVHRWCDTAEEATGKDAKRKVTEEKWCAKGVVTVAVSGWNSVGTTSIETRKKDAAAIEIWGGERGTSQKMKPRSHTPVTFKELKMAFFSVTVTWKGQRFRQHCYFLCQWKSFSNHITYQPSHYIAQDQYEVKPYTDSSGSLPSFQLYA